MSVPTLEVYAGGTGGPGLATGYSVPATHMTPIGGSVYLSDGPRLWQVNESTDTLTTLNAGLGGSAGNGVPVRAERLSIYGMAADSYGNLLLAEGPQHVVRVLALHTGTYYGQAMTAGDLYTIAGDGKPGDTGNGGPALNAELASPSSLVVDHDGNILVSAGNGRVRVVAFKNGTFYGQAMKAGYIYQIFDYAHNGIAVDGSKNLVFATLGGVWLYAESSGTFFGQQMTVNHYYQIATSNGIPSILIDSSGNLLFTGQGTATQVLAARSGTFYNQNMVVGKTYPISRSRGNGIALDRSGVLLIIVPYFNQLDPDTITATTFTAGTFYGQQMTPGNVYPIAGNGNYWSSGVPGPAATAQFMPSGSALSTDSEKNVFLVRANNTIQMIVGTSGTYFGRVLQQGQIYTVAGGGQSQGNTYCNTGSALSIGLNQVLSVAVDSFGNVVFADPGLVHGGCTEVLARQSGTYYGQQMTAGNVYSLPGFKAYSISVDHFGNLVVGGQVWAVRSGTYYGLPMTANTVYQVAGGGPMTVFSGVPGTQAYIGGTPVDSSDAAGNLIIAADNMVRVVANRTGTYYGQAMKVGYIYRIAGLVNPGPVENGIPAVNAHLNTPTTVEIDSAGNVLIADSADNMIRVVAEKTGTFYGQAMKAGYIYRFAGTGALTVSGVKGPAAKASLPAGIMAMLPGGNLLVPSFATGTLLEITNS